LIRKEEIVRQRGELVLEAVKDLRGWRGCCGVEVTSDFIISFFAINFNF
jgi:hypothetical protein